MEGFMLSSSYFKTISQILILAMLHLCWLTSYGYAEMIPTESAIEQPPTSNTDRQRILDLLDRQEVIEELEKYDISKDEATVRINSLTDEEVTQISGKLDGLPTGGSHGWEMEHDSPEWGSVLAVIGVLILVGLLIYWLFSRNKAEVDSPPSKEEPASVPVEEVCDPGMESCDSRIENR
jgi:hypothetical protein